MNYKLTQRQIKLNEQVLQGLYEEYSKLRKVRKEYNDEADKYQEMCYSFAQTLEHDKASEYSDKAQANREQAAIFTPFIRKFKVKIAKLNEVQKALKHDVKCQMCLADWTAEDDAFWLAQAEVAQQEGFVQIGTGQAFETLDAYFAHIQEKESAQPYDQSEAIAGTLGVA